MTSRRTRHAVLGSALLATAIGVLSVAWPLPKSVAPDAASASLRVTDRAGILLREVYPDGRSHPLALADVNPVVVDALLATEDRRFRRHPGIDPLALGRAARQNRREGRVVSGGSTITMQVARARRPAGARGIRAKLADAHLALRLELHLSKDQILALWLNRAPFGNRAYGIEAAAQTYFGKGATDLTLDEAVLLVGLPQSPSRLDPFRHPDRALARRQRVLDALQAAGGITAPEAARLAAQPLDLVEPRRAFRAPHFVEWVSRSSPAGATELRTTIDGLLQGEVEAILRAHVRSLRDNNVTAAAAVVIDNASGEILAYAGSPDFWDERAAGQVDGVQALRQPGSALKPFTYALALQDGRWTAASIVADLELQVIEAGGAFSPENYDRQFHGPVSVRTALASSLNVPAVRVARALGPDALLGTLRQSGFASLLQPADFYGVGLTLGNGEVRLIDLARAYSGIARGGSLPPLRPVRFTVAGGDTLLFPAGYTSPTGMSREVAFIITDILSDPEAREIGFGRGGPLELPFPAAVKTGTSKDYRDNWAVGYTPRHTVAVWTGNFDGSPMQWVSGTRGSGPMLNAILTALGPAGAFHRPHGVVTAHVCPTGGALPGPHCRGLRSELFLQGTAPADTCTVHRTIGIDRRSELLADDATPAEIREERLFTVLPPEYHTWMRQRGMPLPPSATARLARDGTERVSDRLRIDFPAGGTVFQLDPILRADYQRARLRGSADEDLLDVAWFANGHRLSDDLHATDWPLAPGTHTLELRGVSPDGQRLHSAPTVITVRGTPSLPTTPAAAR